MIRKKKIKKLTGKEYFEGGDFSVLEFWQYCFSNLNSNVLRESLAEFIVENLLKNMSNNRSSVSLAKLEKYNILPLRYKEVKDYINKIIKNA